MKTTSRLSTQASVFCFCAFVTTGAFAQVSSINSAVLNPRVFNDIPGATLTSFNLYPGIILFGESGVSAPTGFANRDTWQFSNNSGISAYQFQNTNYFAASMTLQLTGSPISPRKEGGFLFKTASAGDIQFLVNTDGHEVVQFGGISFYSFSANNPISYNSGDTIKLEIDYFPALDGNNALQFFANGFASPIFEFAPGAGIGDGSTLGGYFQILNDPSNPANLGAATFQNISIIPIPEPSSLALFGLGIATLGTVVFRRRSL